jgi:hypothetical protein
LAPSAFLCSAKKAVFPPRPPHAKHREPSASPDWKCDDKAANDLNDAKRDWQMSTLMLVEKLNYTRIVAVDGQCGRLQEIQGQVAGLSHQDAIGAECAASCNNAPLWWQC